MAPGPSRASTLWLTVGTLVLGFALAGCPASLANPEDFADRTEFPSSGGAGVSVGGSNPGSAGSSINLGGGAATDATTPACVLTLFKAGTGACSGSVCHDQHSASAGGLDLGSANVATRLVDVPAAHSGVGPTDVCPTGDLLIDTTNPSASWLLKKLSTTTVGMCGAVMPAAGNLSSIQLSCLENWINNVAPGGT